MKKKVEIELECDLETGNVQLPQAARIHIGNHIGRLFFDPYRGNMILLLDEAAKTDGSIHWRYPSGKMMGFGPLLKKEASNE